MIITISDIRALGYCPRGIRGWFAIHDLDFKDFIRNGIESEVFLSFGDALAEKVVSRKKRELDG